MCSGQSLPHPDKIQYEKCLAHILIAFIHFSIMSRVYNMLDRDVGLGKSPMWVWESKTSPVPVLMECLF